MYSKADPLHNLISPSGAVLNMSFTAGMCQSCVIIPYMMHVVELSASVVQVFQVMPYVQALTTYFSMFHKMSKHELAWSPPLSCNDYGSTTV